MKKELLLSCVFATLASPALMAEQFEGKTQLVQDAAVQYTVIPGYYTELSGTFNFNIQEVYNAIYNQVGLLVNRQYWIIDSNNEIVYDGKGNMSPVGTGMRSQNNFNCVIPTENKITEEGVYYFVLATDTPHTDNNNAQLYTTGESVHIDNLMFGPYHVVSQLNDPVEAKISVSPAGEIDASYFDVEEGASHNSLITLTVEDVSVMGCGAIDNNFKVTDPKGAAVSMDLLSIDGGTLSMEFPTGYEPVPGKYTVTVDFSDFSGFTANAEPIVFPDTPQTYTFTVSGVALEELTTNMISFMGLCRN